MENNEIIILYYKLISASGWSHNTVPLDGVHQPLYAIVNTFPVKQEA